MVNWDYYTTRKVLVVVAVMTLILFPDLAGLPLPETIGAVIGRTLGVWIMVAVGKRLIYGSPTSPPESGAGGVLA